MKLFFISIFCMLFLTVLGAQKASFHITSRLVQVPVDVFNSQGKFVPGLTANDFRLRLNGKVWPIANLDLIHTNHRGAHASITGQWRQWRKGEFNNQLQESPHNRIVFLFDMIHIPKMARAQLQRQITRILHQPVPGDEDIEILEENPGLIEVQPFTRNRALLQNAVNQIGNYHTPHTIASVYRDLGGLYGGLIGGDAVPLQYPTRAISPEPSNSIYSDDVIAFSRLIGTVVSRQQYYGTVDTLNMIARLLGNIPGHKEILWFTNDTNYTAPGNPNLLLSGKRLRLLTRNLNSANISLFPIDPDGLSTYSGSSNPGYLNNPSMRASTQGIDPDMLMTHDLASQGAATFAARTGGRAYSDFNSMAKILVNAQRYWNSGYILYFRPPSVKSGKNQYFNLQVQVLHSGVHAIYRKGFYLRGQAYRPRVLNHQALQKIATAPMDWHGLPLSLQLTGMGPAIRPQWKPAYKNEKIRRAAFQLRLPMRRLLHRLPDGHFSFDFTVQIITINIQTGAVETLSPDHFHQMLDRAQAAGLRGQTQYFRSDFILDNGFFYIGRVILRDNYSRQIGSVTLPLNALMIQKPH